MPVPCDKKKQVRHAEQVFRGVAEGGQGHGWCKRVEGDMGHTRLKIGGQGGPVEHTGEKEVRVIPKGKEGKKTKKPKKNSRNVCEKVTFSWTHTLARIDPPAEPGRL